MSQSFDFVNRAFYRMQDVFGWNKCDFNEFFKSHMMEMTMLIEGLGDQKSGGIYGFCFEVEFY